jgi:hypothetical protein
VERALAQVRAVVEHPFHIIKNRFRRECPEFCVREPPLFSPSAR